MIAQFIAWNTYENLAFPFANFVGLMYKLYTTSSKVCACAVEIFESTLWCNNSRIDKSNRIHKSSEVKTTTTAAIIGRHLYGIFMHLMYSIIIYGIDIKNTYCNTSLPSQYGSQQNQNYDNKTLTEMQQQQQQPTIIIRLVKMSRKIKVNVTKGR